MYEIVLIAAGFVVVIALLVAVLLRFGALARDRDAAAREGAELRGRLEAFGRGVADHERDVRQDLAIARNESAGAGTALRQEIGDVMARYAETNAQLHAAAANAQATELKAFGERLAHVSQASETRLDALRRTLEERLDVLRTDNAQKLEQMRATVDEKLQTTLEQRLGASFRQVSERLDQVHKGLGEMQTLATGVGDLKRVLSNVKSRGTWGEVQLGALLADLLPASQYAQNVVTRPGSKQPVEFAVRFPGLADVLQREFRVTIAGPTTLAALLNSLQLGFRTLAIERRSTEVWRVLGAVKTEFDRFGALLAKTKDKLVQVSNTLDEAGRKSTTIARKLRDVEALPEREADRLLTSDEPGVIDLDADEPTVPQLAEPPVH